MKFHRYILEVAVFICGAVVMVYELVGSRVLAPYVGTSLFVWTSLIGIILGSLSIGYYFGGRLADKNASYKNLAVIVALAASGIALVLVLKDPVLKLLELAIDNIKMNSVIGAIVLFGPTSMILGMMSPYAAKLKLDSLTTSGTTIGQLYALSTAGSIAGTFLAGFWLIPQFGTNKLLTILAITLLIVSLALAAKPWLNIKVGLMVLLLMGWFGLSSWSAQAEQLGFIDVDTAYNRIWIYDYKDTRHQAQLVKVMGINNENHSAMFVDSPELVNEYTKYYHLARHFVPNFSTSLMVGGAGYSFPKDFLVTYPAATIDVIEIDPAVTALAQKYFKLPTNPRLTIHHTDGRVYLNTTTTTYDVIFGDAFSSKYSLPYQLTTQETVQQKYNHLADNGAVILNIISAIEGDAGKFLRAEYATYQSVFPQVYLLPVQYPEDGTTVQNIMLVALKATTPPSFTSADPILNQYLQHRWTKPITSDMPILTDDYAPVDYYINQAL